MIVLRPARSDDTDGLQDMLARAGARLTGMSSLLPNPEHVAARVEHSLAAFAADVDAPGEESYLFVLDDDGTVVGMSGVIAAVGLTDAFWSYRVGTIVKSSRELGIYRRIPTLYLTNDYTGHAELCSLFLDPERRGSATGRLLSLGRLLYLADHHGRFAPEVIAEMRGVLEPDGTSPFWQGLGRHFFGLPFGDADDIYGQGNKQFIAELMPHHPVYVNLLPAAAQAVIGEVHENTAPARKMLEAEGLRYEGYIDIFDGGPTLAGPVASLRSVVESVECTVRPGAGSSDVGNLLVSNRRHDDFRCVAVPGSVPSPDEPVIELDSDAVAALELKPDDTVRVVTVRPILEPSGG